MQHARLPLANRNRLLLLSMLPLPLAILATFAMVLLVGERFPRQIAPGSSLSGMVLHCRDWCFSPSFITSGGNGRT
ncbi:MAG: hypothetical protein QHC67_15350 [Sphingobium sp.]|uniref:hypothetical protein n=1 Tax=Sphingobium sp. TaxID=1912891 RepID=UPI0029AD191F|nr:hypothetical protein [Sphingobium sp.]MDX3911175.1 hypothetical protein [Sphingobium sp.]